MSDIWSWAHTSLSHTDTDWHNVTWQAEPGLFRWGLIAGHGFLILIWRDHTERDNFSESGQNWRKLFKVHDTVLPMTLSPLISTFGPFHIIHALGGQIKYIEIKKRENTKLKSFQALREEGILGNTVCVLCRDPFRYLHDWCWWLMRRSQKTGLCACRG